MIGLARRLRQAGVVGINARNCQLVMPYNQRRLYPLVDNKVLTKQALLAHDIAVPHQLGVVRSQYQSGALAERLEGLDEFVIKPASGSGGDGILVARGRRRDAWLGPSGRLMSMGDIRYHVSGILAGMYSLSGQLDAALLEALVHPDPALRPIAPEGVPDIRIIVFRGVPAMAMMRLPTRRSGGKANLHQGAIGAGIDLATGRTMSAVMHSSVVDVHPDTAEPVTGFEIPGWEKLLHLSARCFDAVGLGYLGVDLVLDAERGPLVLELNARPGLAIQIANHAGLRHRLDAINRLESPERLTADERLERCLDLRH